MNMRKAGALRDRLKKLEILRWLAEDLRMRQEEYAGGWLEEDPEYAAVLDQASREVATEIASIEAEVVA